VCGLAAILDRRGQPVARETIERMTERPAHRGPETPQWWTLDAPLHALASAVRRDGIKVAFSGQGSDELLAGYDAFRTDRARRVLGRFPLALFRGRLLRSMLARTDSAPDTIDFLVALLRQPQREVIRRFGMWPARFTEWNLLSPLGVEPLAEPIRAAAGEAGERQLAFIRDEIAPRSRGSIR